MGSRSKRHSVLLIICLTLGKSFLLRSSLHFICNGWSKMSFKNSARSKMLWILPESKSLDLAFTNYIRHIQLPYRLIHIFSPLLKWAISNWRINNLPIVFFCSCSILCLSIFYYLFAIMLSLMLSSSISSVLLDKLHYLILFGLNWWCFLLLLLNRAVQRTEDTRFDFFTIQFPLLKREYILVICLGS